MPLTDVERIEKAVIERLRAERKKQGLSYEKLAVKAGLHRTAISFIERGINHPSLLNCLKLAEALGVSLRDLMRG
ncbi:MAG TPA: helix-turn-helix transcriptional regulator [Alphaproteobacteria bacterium]|nr:helix-turn-helix transcriptional regulator [Alphaproteobacteria bacterium]